LKQGNSVASLGALLVSLPGALSTRNPYSE
jgi:hypothetical protein